MTFRPKSAIGCISSLNSFQTPSLFSSEPPLASRTRGLGEGNGGRLCRWWSTVDVRVRLLASSCVPRVSRGERGLAASTSEVRSILSSSSLWTASGLFQRRRRRPARWPWYGSDRGWWEKNMETSHYSATADLAAIDSVFESHGPSEPCFSSHVRRSYLRPPRHTFILIDWGLVSIT